MKYIQKIRLQNFKRFGIFECEFDSKLNIIIGDNEAGKTSILTAIDLVLSGSRSKIESIGLENLFNIDIIQEYLASEKNYEDLPKLCIELYLNEQDNPDLNGRNNEDKKTSDGLKLICEPNDDLGSEIKEVIKQTDANFPFEFYSITFKTFSGETFTGYRKFLRHILIDNTQTSNEYATKEYIRDIYHSNIKDATEKLKHDNEYRKHKEHFKTTVLSELNKRTDEYHFGIRTSPRSNLETDLTILESNVSIENRGKGRQCFIKTDFALKKKQGDLDVVLIEEPENHLSHVNMKKLVNKISESDDKQVFIATHNDLISARLDLRKSILLNSNSISPLTLQALPETTAKFFIKAPDNNILQFILSKKVILVEGDAEYILMDAFFKKVLKMKLWDSDVHIISAGGTTFKRYLDIAKVLGLKTAVIRDNDGDHNTNCKDRYSEYVSDNIQIFFDDNNARSTFEIAFYEDNKSVCDALFAGGRKTLSVQEYMLKNKADCAFELLDKKAADVVTPSYIEKALVWVSA